MAELMKDDKVNNSVCQLQTLYEGATDLNLFDKLWLVLLRLRSALLRRCESFKRTIAKRSLKVASTHSVSGEPSDRSQKNIPLKAGDMAQVLSMDEIRKTFDKNRVTRGLWFMPGMEKYCGMKLRVFKRVNYLFDERAWKMRKAKNVLILEGVLCSGEGMFSKEGCDRSCYFFWKECWLKKI